MKNFAIKINIKKLINWLNTEIGSVLFTVVGLWLIMNFAVLFGSGKMAFEIFVGCIEFAIIGYILSFLFFCLFLTKIAYGFLKASNVFLLVLVLQIITGVIVYYVGAALRFLM